MRPAAIKLVVTFMGSEGGGGGAAKSTLKWTNEWPDKQTNRQAKQTK